MELQQKKYKSTNPVSRLLVRRFHNQLVKVIACSNDCSSFLEVGCGEGRILNLVNDFFAGTVPLVGVDVDKLRLSYAKKNASFACIVDASIYELPYADNSQHTVLCTEVLEHLEYPDMALEEIKRVAREYVILTVPNEPIWRILNMIRGAYWPDLGNTPGHLNHWSSKSFERFVSTKMQVLKCQRSLPWTLVLARPYNNT